MVLSKFFLPYLALPSAMPPQRTLFRRFRDWQDYHRLAQMDDARLRDIGLTHDQVRKACKFWDRSPN